MQLLPESFLLPRARSLPVRALRSARLMEARLEKPPVLRRVRRPVGRRQRGWELKKARGLVVKLLGMKVSSILITE